MRGRRINSELWVWGKARKKDKKRERVLIKNRAKKGARVEVETGMNCSERVKEQHSRRWEL